MTIARLVAASACVASLLSIARLARAQECPVADIGRTCSHGTCVKATCRDTSADGAVVVRDCAACAYVEPNACPPDDVGKPCGDGGVCWAGTAGMGSGAVGGPDGAPGPSQEITYPAPVCAVLAEGGAGGAVGVPKGRADAAVQSSDDDAAMHAVVDSPAPAAPEESGGCSASKGRTGARGAAALALLAALCVIRRRLAVFPATRAPAVR